MKLDSLSIDKVNDRAESMKITRFFESDQKQVKLKKTPVKKVRIRTLN